MERPGRISFLIGETAPFHVTFQFFSFEFDDEEAAEKHWKEKLDGWQKEGASWAVDKVSAITPRFDNLVYAKPEDLESAGLDFTDVATTLATEVPNDFGGLAYGTDQWEGVAAFNFFNNFYNPMVDCVDNQEWLANMLMRGCAFAKGIIDAGQHSCMTTVTTMVERVQDALEQRQDAHSISPSEWLVIAETALSLVDDIPLLDAVKTKPTGVDETPRARGRHRLRRPGRRVRPRGSSAGLRRRSRRTRRTTRRPRSGSPRAWPRTSPRPWTGSTRT